MPNKNGLELIVPTSITKTGTGSTATINTNGSVTCTSCTSLSLNGVFSSTYDNYQIVFSGVSGAASYIQCRWRASGTDNATASSYTDIWWYSVGASQGKNTGTQDHHYIIYNDASRSGFVGTIYGPNLAQRTVSRWSAVSMADNTVVYDFGGIHNQSTAYDGITFHGYIGIGQTFSGLFAVYGMRD